jgi:N-acetyl-anhydromuramyl-L-alanine amidase AmpD
MVDNDGTIYQTIDLAFMAYHAAEYNIPSIGVEISNRGEALHNESAYDKTPWKGKGKHEVRSCTINNSKILCFEFTDDQVKAMTQLCLYLRKFLPNIPIEYPQDLPGHASLDTLTLAGGREGGAFGYKGYLGHYHCTFRKWDPGPWDFKKFCEGMRGQRVFPLWTAKAQRQPTDKPDVPTKSEDRTVILDTLHKMNEENDDGGFFPVGPWGDNRLWHGGVHLKTDFKAPIWSPFPGHIVAARMGRSSPFGSVNFVLIRHDIAVGQVSMRFFALYMHLFDESSEKDPAQQPPWMKKDSWKAAQNWKQIAKPEDRDKVWDVDTGVALLDDPIDAGEIIGRVGKAGPDNRPQIHFEIFSESQVLEKFSNARIEVHDGSGSGRFVDDPDIINKIDTSPKDGKLSHDELSNFFGHGGERDQFRQIAAYFISEWTAEPDWGDALKTSPEFKDPSHKDAVDEMVAEQITPGLWWDAQTAKHCSLRADGLVYHYNPIDFIGFLNGAIEEAALLAPPPPDPHDLKGAGNVAAGVTDDNIGDTGASSVTKDQIDQRDPYEDLTFDQMVQGFEPQP